MLNFPAIQSLSAAQKIFGGHFLTECPPKAVFSYFSRSLRGRLRWERDAVFCFRRHAKSGKNAEDGSCKSCVGGGRKPGLDPHATHTGKFRGYHAMDGVFFDYSCVFFAHIAHRSQKQVVLTFSAKNFLTVEHLCDIMAVACRATFIFAAEVT